MTHPYFAGTRHPRVLAHRGLIPPGEDSSVWENTAASFAAAHAAGVEYIETDTRATADGDAVLFHDATLQRLFGDPRPVSEVRTRELAELLAPHGGLLTVAEALDGFPDSRFNIDVKADAAVDAVGRAVASSPERVLLTSFDDARRRRALTAAASSSADGRPASSGGRSVIARVRLLSALRLSAGRALADVDALQIPRRYGPVRVLDGAFVRAAHRHGVEVHVWTVNDPDEMRAVVAAGADGVVTDRADVALKVFSQL